MSPGSGTTGGLNFRANQVSHPCLKLMGGVGLLYLTSSRVTRLLFRSVVIMNE